MKRQLMILFLLLSLIIGTVTQVAFASGASQLAIPRAVVNTSFLNVRTGDGPQYSIVAVVVGGTELPVLGINASNSWYMVATAVGPGWVDVSFTLPRGDFRNIPVLDPTVGTALAVQTPLTIGLPQVVAVGAATTIQTPLQTSSRAVLNVISVNFRTQPADNGPVIQTLYKDDNKDYAIVGYAYDNRGVRWIAITVPGLGTGWIEEAKVRVNQVSGTSSGVAVPALGVPHVVINTGFQNIRTGPGPQYGVVAVVAGGTKLDAIAVNDSSTWFQVRGTFGQGWVASEFVIFRGTFSNLPVIQSAF